MPRSRLQHKGEKRTANSDKVYRFVGEGLGVPGLPHIIKYGDAARLGVEEILKAAIKNGNYAELTAETVKED